MLRTAAWQRATRSTRERAPAATSAAVATERLRAAAQGLPAADWLDSARVSSYACGMCIICVDFNRGALKAHEARRALREMRETLSEEHVREVERALDDADDESDARTP